MSAFETETHGLAPPDVAARLEAGEIELIDVREDHEVAEARIPGARQVRLGELAEAAATFPPDRPIVLQCAHGSRSRMAAEALRGAGFDAYNLEGGIAAWSQAGLPMEPEGKVVD